MDKKITIELTIDQARIIASDMEDRIKNHESWLEKYDDPNTQRKLAFRKRLLNKIQ
jgi:hypothetical protein